MNNSHEYHKLLRQILPGEPVQILDSLRLFRLALALDVDDVDWAAKSQSAQTGSTNNGERSTSSTYEYESGRSVRVHRRRKARPFAILPLANLGTPVCTLH
jgi:hypothetical protein